MQEILTAYPESRYGNSCHVPKAKYETINLKNASLSINSEKKFQNKKEVGRSAVIVDKNMNHNKLSMAKARAINETP